MKYLFTKNATGQYRVPGLRFDPFLEGRSWIGVARVSDEIAGAATAKYPGIQVITEEQFNFVKKNGTKDSDSFRTIIQDATRPQRAQYADEIKTISQVEEKNAIDLLMVSEAEVPAPKAKPQAKRAKSKGKAKK